MAQPLSFMMKSKLKVVSRMFIFNRQDIRCRFYRKTLSPSDKNRLENIVGPYHKRIFETVEGKYWKDYLIMPDRLVEWNGKIGVVLPFYPSKYFFKGGPFDGKEKKVNGLHLQN